MAARQREPKASVAVSMSRTYDVVVNIVTHHGVKAPVREVQLVGVPMLKPAPGCHTFALGVLLAHGLAIAVGTGAACRSSPHPD